MSFLEQAVSERASAVSSTNGSDLGFKWLLFNKLIWSLFCSETFSFICALQLPLSVALRGQLTGLRFKSSLCCCQPGNGHAVG